MKRTTQIALGLLVSCLLASSGLSQDLTVGMTAGKPTFKSVGPLSFGPNGILFVADAQSAAITAIDTQDTKPGATNKLLKVEGINGKIAALLGTAADQILINDMAINPISRNAYLAVSRGRGPEAVGVLIRVTPDGAVEAVSLDNVKFSRTELTSAPADAVPASGRGRNPRTESITDIAFVQDKVIVAGLANEEFASTLRTIPFPFAAAGAPTSVEIYHGAHGAFETRSPVRTFVTYTVGQEAQLLAAYTCTPLVQIPMSDLKPGAKVKGKTIAEFGNGNQPLDIIVYQKNGKDFLLMANSRRGVMKVSTDSIPTAESITSRVADTKGLPFETVQDWANVVQLDRLDAQHAVVIQGTGAAANLNSLPLP